jgi:hypothetical protein
MKLLLIPSSFFDECTDGHNSEILPYGRITKNIQVSRQLLFPLIWDRVDGAIPGETSTVV